MFGVCSGLDVDISAALTYTREARASSASRQSKKDTQFLAADLRAPFPLKENSLNSSFLRGGALILQGLQARACFLSAAVALSLKAVPPEA